MASNAGIQDSTTETDEGRVVKAEIYKAEGNEFFKMGEYKKAIKKYHFALMYLKGIGEKHPITQEQKVLTEDWKKRFDEMKFSCYNNLAACLVKDNRWEKVIEYSNKALEVHPENAKAWFRKGQGYYHTRNWDKAFEALNQARKLEPDDANIKKYEIKVEQELKKYREKEKIMYAGMFAK
ncbi:tetratricopeptide repeat protein 9C-like [Dendronephthya gigantea]|uniref:tetratricopeptide repeat protein 9C-like n=1 Tax=Dendronephthya gigantea TaxID=151771 RepID=UPI00106D719A|nr:tetratricopeptide repeat protein 9C-like [Dendronephthya gigantea]